MAKYDYDNAKVQYGMYREFFKIDLALEWFDMSNDDFFEKYKFNFNPHEYAGLYKIASELYFNGNKT